jgi:magnesium transporter
MKHQRSRIKKTGMAPGSLVFTGQQKVDQTQINVLTYDVESCKELHLDADLWKHISDERMTWLDIRGVHDVNILEDIGQAFKIHPLVMEDIADTHQRPKFEEYDNGYFITMRAFRFDPSMENILHEQISLYVKHNVVLSFQEDQHDVFTGVRERLIQGGLRLRKFGADYLSYALVDNVIDYYFQILDSVEDTIDKLELEITTNPTNVTKSKIHGLRLELLTLRKGISPLREVVSRFMKSEHNLITPNTALFIRDLYDHTIQSMELVESYRDTLAGMQDLYLSEISFKMNAVMQMLTIISTIFIPLTFLAGIYGMNFDNIPELHHEYGYFILLGVMGTVALVLLLLFKRRKWL